MSTTMNAVANSLAVIQNLDEKFFENMAKHSPHISKQFDSMKRLHKLLQKSRTRPDILTKPSDETIAMPRRATSEPNARDMK